MFERFKTKRTVESSKPKVEAPPTPLELTQLQIGSAAVRASALLGVYANSVSGGYERPTRHEVVEKALRLEAGPGAIVVDERQLVFGVLESIDAAGGPDAFIEQYEAEQAALAQGPESTQS